MLDNAARELFEELDPRLSWDKFESVWKAVSKSFEIQETDEKTETPAVPESMGDDPFGVIELDTDAANQTIAEANRDDLIEALSEVDLLTHETFEETLGLLEHVPSQTLLLIFEAFKKKEECISKFKQLPQKNQILRELSGCYADTKAQKTDQMASSRIRVSVNVLHAFHKKELEFSKDNLDCFFEHDQDFSKESVRDVLFHLPSNQFTQAWFDFVSSVSGKKNNGAVDRFFTAWDRLGFDESVFHYRSILSHGVLSKVFKTIERTEIPREDLFTKKWSQKILGICQEYMDNPTEAVSLICQDLLHKVQIFEELSGEAQTYLSNLSSSIANNPSTLFHQMIGKDTENIEHHPYPDADKPRAPR
jgi:hypothetical protein